MKIIWICNIILPEISQKENLPVANGGGWLVGLSNDLLKEDNISLIVCFPCEKKIEGAIGRLRYTSFSKKNTELDMLDIIGSASPDIIHIFGTEYAHALAAVNACERLKKINRVVVSVQGMVSVCAKHYFNGVPRNVQKGFSFRDIIKRQNIELGKRDFQERGKNEKEVIKKVRHVIGRTDWDYACTHQINPSVNYHFCNESLRDSFYEHNWEIGSCERQSIFVSQCGYPLKGFHRVLEALAIVLRFYPDAKVYTTGRPELTDKKLRSRLKLSYYEKYLLKQIKKLGLEKHVEFLGGLNEKAMCKQFLKSHVFVSASSIENSPNSVGEAMLLGVPTISSDVGGVKNMLLHGVEGLVYQHDAPYMLAHYICEIFKDDERAKMFSTNAKIHAQKTHDRKKNAEKLLHIYFDLLEK